VANGGSVVGPKEIALLLVADGHPERQQRVIPQKSYAERSVCRPSETIAFLFPLVRRADLEGQRRVEGSQTPLRQPKLSEAYLRFAYIW
jgi:hypothetical protein